MRLGIAGGWWCRLAQVRTVVLALCGAVGPVGAAPSTWRTECVGYQTMQLPGDIEYAVQQPPLERDWNPKFADGLGVWGTSFRVGLNSNAERLDKISISTQSDQLALASLANTRNNSQQKFKEDLLRKAKLFDDSPDTQKTLLNGADQVGFYKPFNNGAAFVLREDRGLAVDVLVGDRIVNIGLSLLESPQQTLDAFLKRYHSRPPFQIPQEAGVCLPYAFITGETQPASVGISMRLKDRPDIVIYLRDGKDLSVLEPPKSAKAYLSRAVQNFFYGATLANPLDGDLKPFHSITIDGREGLGGFGIVTRQKGSGPEAFNNEANQDKDWAYLAYVPADKKAARGMSSDLVFKVERFGRFAKQPMSEKEFRVLVKTIAASIKRRPGAWVAR
jgi:hypothetical protein